jgi:hypothetical protein
MMLGWRSSASGWKRRLDRGLIRAQQWELCRLHRVSAQRRQGRSGLGLEARQNAVRDHLNGGNWRIVAEFTEVESGKRSDRPKLAEALKTCRALGATLIIAKLDRLARNVHFVSGLMESGVEFTAVDFPQVRIASRSTSSPPSPELSPNLGDGRGQAAA